MRIKYPNSFLKLLLFGFAFAVLPLMLAFVNTNIAFNKLSKKSQITIDGAVKATRTSLVLQQQLHLMERSARQYFVLKDEDLFNNYLSSRQTFVKALVELGQTQIVAGHQNQILQLTAVENDLYQAVLNEKNASDPQQKVLNQFDLISASVDELIKKNNQAIDDTSVKLDLESKRSQSRFFLQSLVLIPFSLLIMGIIAYMLGRPILRMDSAIKDLGKGDYQQEISIDGPGDLRILGQRLNWLRQVLLNLKEQKQQFLQHVSHELKTPLTAIREAAELLSDGVGGKLNAQQHEIIFIMRENSIRLQKMIEHLLSFTKMESDKSLLIIETIPTEALVQEVLASHELSIRNKQLQIKIEHLTQHLVADRAKLMIVLDNIISNAVKYTPDKGEITLITQQDKSWQTIQVIDTGPGLSKEEKSRIFDPFYQGKTIYQGLVESSGLGLSIAKNFIEEHQGTIELVETSQHRDSSTIGAHFVIRIPKLELTSTEKT